MSPVISNLLHLHDFTLSVDGEKTTARFSSSDVANSSPSGATTRVSTVKVPLPNNSKDKITLTFKADASPDSYGRVTKQIGPKHVEAFTKAYFDYAAEQGRPAASLPRSVTVTDPLQAMETGGIENRARRQVDEDTSKARPPAQS